MGNACDYTDFESIYYYLHQELDFLTHFLSKEPVNEGKTVISQNFHANAQD